MSSTKDKLQWIIHIAIWLVLTFIFTNWFYEFHANHLDETGEYMLPKILSWLPDAVGINTTFWILAIFVGMTSSIVPMGLYYICLDWLKVLKAKLKS